MDLLTRTYELIGKSKLTYREIADGANVDVNWFAKFKQRRIGSPGVEKVQKVHDFLIRRASSSRKHAA
jgi:transcriptional regulator with XRE-family HTH domain